MDLKLRCSAGGCDCKFFTAAGDSAESLRICDSCNHTWITHLLEKLLTAADDQLSVFDVCSLALYGTHALPIRIKIVIERLLTTLNTEDIEKIRRNFGWTLQDLARGYMVQDPRGGLINRWSLLPPEEELIILQQFLRFPITRSISLALIKEDFPSVVNNNNNVLGTSHPLTNLNNIINNNTTNINSSMNGKHGKASVSPQQSISPLHQLSSLGIHHSSSKGIQASGFSSLPAAGPKMRSTSPRGQDPVSIYSSLSSSSSALNLSVAQNSSDSESERDYLQDRKEQHHNHHRRRPEMFSHIPHGAHAHSGGDSVMDLSVKPGQNMNFGHSGGGNFSTSSLLKARGMTVSQALKSVRQATTSPKAGQNPPSSFEENLNQTLGLMGMNMSNLLSNLGNIKSTDLMAAAAAQQFLTSVTASLQQQQHHHQHQQQQQKKNVSGSGQTSSGSGSTSPGITNNNGNSFSAKQPSLNSLSSIKQEIVKQEQSPNNSTASKKNSGGKRSWNPLPAPVAMATHLVNPATGKRRVQCAVCLKTFCDKGALKIHFSAVHLREMHKCTVVGCSMMFSSRRSRNRHSANPNPKLHSPHIRRKISPHDGRTAGPVLSLNSPNHSLMLPPGMRYPPFLGGLPVNGSPIEDEGINTEDYQHDDGQSLSGEEDLVEAGMMVKMVKEEITPEDYMSDDGSFSSANEDSRQKLSPEINNKQDGARKRKRNNPVRLPSVPDDSNDEFCCYDDGTGVTNENDEDNSTTGSPKRLKEEEMNKEGRAGEEEKSQSPPSAENESVGAAIDLAKSPNTCSSPKEPRDDKEVRDTDNENKKHNHNSHSSEEEDDKEESNPRDQDVNHLGRLQNLPIFSQEENDSEGSSELGKSDDEENTGRSIGSPNSSNGYIPMDRDNPRKCSACGKEFQNQFGVKTHYQNVHLKLMHKCSVDGCNAAFPSKRSRDRHSSNLNLHRKLLSTSSDYSPPPMSRSRSASPPSSTGSAPDISSISPRPSRRPEIDFMTSATTTALSSNQNPMSMFNPYIFRNNLLLENSLYIN